MALREQVELDIAAALRQIDQIEQQLRAASHAALDLTIGNMASFEADIARAVDAADTTVTILAEAGDVTASIDGAVAAADTDISVTADTDDAEQGITGIGDAAVIAAGRGSHLSGVLAGIGAGAVLKGLYDATVAATDLGEAQSKAATVFGDSLDVITELADNSVEALQLTNAEALGYAGTLGNLVVGLGGTREAAADMSAQALQLAADLGSFNNLQTGDVLEKIRSGLVGEVEPLRELGVNFNAAQVQAKAFELGLADSNGVVSEAGLVQARFALIMQQTATAQGDLARTQDSAANQMKTFATEVRQAQIELGLKLIPSLTEMLGVAREELLPALSKLGEAAIPLIAEAMSGASPVISAFADVLGALTPAIEAIADLVADIPEPVLSMVAAFLALRQVTGVVSELELLNKILGLLPISAEAAATGLGLVAGSLTILGAAYVAIRVLDDQQHKSIAESLDERIGDVDTARLEDVREAIATLKERQKELKATDDVLLSGNTFQQAPENKKSRGIELDEISIKLAQLEGQEEILSSTENVLADSVDDTTVAYRSAADATQEYIAALQDVEDQLNAQFDPLFGILDANRDLRDAREAAAKAERDHGKDSREYVEASEGVIKAAQRNTDAQLGLARAVEENPDLIDEARRQLVLWVAQGDITEQQAKEVAKQFEKISDKAADDVEFKVKLDAEKALADMQKLNDLLAQAASHDIVLDEGFFGANFSPPTKAAAGFQGTVLGPQSFLIGEGGEPEDVLIVPHSKGGIGVVSAVNQINADMNNVTAAVAAPNVIIGGRGAAASGAPSRAIFEAVHFNDYNDPQHVFQAAAFAFTEEVIGQ